MINQSPLLDADIDSHSKMLKSAGIRASTINRTARIESQSFGVELQGLKADHFCSSPTYSFFLAYTLSVVYTSGSDFSDSIQGMGSPQLKWGRSLPHHPQLLCQSSTLFSVVNSSMPFCQQNPPSASNAVHTLCQTELLFLGRTQFN